MTVQMQTTDVAAAVDKAVPMVMPQAAEHDIRLVVEPPAAPLQVCADPTRLVQVLVNLLSNGIKYNRRGGEVRLACRRRGGGRVRISVADTGRGIAPDQRERLFRAFERLGAESGDIEGAGIGLAFSHRMAALMGGELGFDSEIGRGSTFWIDLPEVPSQPLPA
jgi:signal transduction histidine kinase